MKRHAKGMCWEKIALTASTWSTLMRATWLSISQEHKHVRTDVLVSHCKAIHRPAREHTHQHSPNTSPAILSAASSLLTWSCRCGRSWHCQMLPATGWTASRQTDSHTHGWSSNSSMTGTRRATGWIVRHADRYTRVQVREARTAFSRQSELRHLSPPSSP